VGQVVVLDDLDHVLVTTWKDHGVVLSILVCKKINILEWHGEDIVDVNELCVGKSKRQGVIIGKHKHIFNNVRQGRFVFCSCNDHPGQSVEGTQKLRANVLGGITCSFSLVVWQCFWPTLVHVDASRHCSFLVGFAGGLVSSMILASTRISCSVS
jgi:hypothetical protein